MFVYANNVFNAQSYNVLLMLALGYAFFYLVIYRPEKKRRKALAEQIDKMQPGDKVVAMGIIGVLESTKENSIILKMVDGAKVEFLKAAITYVERASTLNNVAP